MHECNFEDVEITLEDRLYCSGTAHYCIEDGAVGWVPYGNTQVWHPGDGDCIEMESITIDEVTDEDGVCLLAKFSGNQKWMKQLEQAVEDKLCAGDELIEHAKKGNE